jgi:hypothetical protein
MERLLCAAEAGRAAIGHDDTPILADRLCAVEDGADLFPEPLSTAVRQVVLREGIWLDAELAGEMMPDGDGDLPAVAGEPAFHLKELQQDGETE